MFQTFCNYEKIALFYTGLHFQIHKTSWHCVTNILWIIHFICVFPIHVQHIYIILSVGRTSNLQEMHLSRCGHQSPTWFLFPCVQHRQLAFTSPVITRYPWMLQLGGLLPQLTHVPYRYSWADWSKVSCTLKWPHWRTFWLVHTHTLYYTQYFIVNTAH